MSPIIEKVVFYEHIVCDLCHLPFAKVAYRIYVCTFFLSENYDVPV